MGYRISWLAARVDGKSMLLNELGFTDTGEPDAANEAPFSVAKLPTGWTVFWSNEELFCDEVLAADVSRVLGSVVMVHVNETVMHSTAAFFVAGERRWYLHHEGDECGDFCESEGELPPGARSIEEAMRVKQAEAGDDVDYLFDVPLDVAKQVCGYKHDMIRFDWGEPSFTVVHPAPQVPARTGFFGRLFGA